MRRREHDGRRLPCLERLLPARGADAPAIAGHETGEAEPLTRRREIVADRLREGEEPLGHHGADSVHAEIAGARPARAVAIEACQRVERARVELAAEDVAPWLGFAHADSVRAAKADMTG